jgi:hypothetical protein
MAKVLHRISTDAPLAWNSSNDNIPSGSLSLDSCNVFSAAGPEKFLSDLLARCPLTPPGA